MGFGEFIASHDEGEGFADLHARKLEVLAGFDDDLGEGEVWRKGGVEL